MKNQSYIKLFLFGAFFCVTTMIVCSDDSNESVVQFLKQSIEQDEKTLDPEIVAKLVEGYEFMGFFYIMKNYPINGYFLFDKKIATVILEFCDLKDGFFSLPNRKKYCLLIHDKIKIKSLVHGHKSIAFDTQDDFAGVTLRNVFIPVSQECNLGKLDNENEVEEMRKELQERIIPNLQDK
jgi:hypothetical protein